MDVANCVRLFTAEYTLVVALFAAVLRQHVVDRLCCTFFKPPRKHTQGTYSLSSPYIDRKVSLGR